MGSFIDRNPDQMIRFADDAAGIVDEMTLLVRKLESLLDESAKDLDDPTRKQINSLHECCDKYYKVMDSYREVAEDIKAKGKRLRDARTEG